MVVSKRILRKRRRQRQPDMLPEYDFSKGIRGKYAKQYAEGVMSSIFPRTWPRYFQPLSGQGGKIANEKTVGVTGACSPRIARILKPDQEFLSAADFISNRQLVTCLTH
jgi:hypothetical protein